MLKVLFTKDFIFDEFLTHNLLQENFMFELIKEIPSMTEAIRCALRKSGLTDKQVHMEMGIDGGQWSRIMTGQSNFPHDRLIEFMKIVRSELPLFWLAHKCGYDLKISKEKLEKEVDRYKEENKNLKLQLDSIIETLKKAEFPL